MLDLFADFYGALYSTRRDFYSEAWLRKETKAVAAFTAQEVEDQLKKMAKNKAADNHGIVVEMLQLGGPRLFEVLAMLFSDLLSPEAIMPNHWRETRLK
eukprot:2183250-Karenia_brevis.AAC.1